VLPADRNGRVLLVGIGGLGTAAALELAREGVPVLGLVDGDVVELSNLHRQLLHGLADVGRKKAEVARQALAALAPGMTIHVYPERVTEETLPPLLDGYDIVIDATDDPPTKFLLNDACVRARRPLVHAGAVGFVGQLFTILPGETACLRCLFPEPPAEDEAPACREAGILGPLAGWIGLLEAGEALKWLRLHVAIHRSGDRPTDRLLADRMLSIDLRRPCIREVPLRRSPACPVCAGLGVERGGSAARS
jgi:molybdopterin/thiamine biosynthesis adenylyltransferase